MAGYSGKPLAAKLGIKPGMPVVLLGAPDALHRLGKPGAQVFDIGKFADQTIARTRQPIARGQDLDYRGSPARRRTTPGARRHAAQDGSPPIVSVGKSAAQFHPFFPAAGCHTPQARPAATIWERPMAAKPFLDFSADALWNPAGSGPANPFRPT